MNSTLGSVVPLVMFHISQIMLLVAKLAISKRQFIFRSKGLPACKNAKSAATKFFHFCLSWSSYIVMMVTNMDKFRILIFVTDIVHIL